MAEKKIDDGGPAFPGTEPSRLHDSLGGQRSREWPINLGMSLRDWFAGKALPAAMALKLAELASMAAELEKAGVKDVDELDNAMRELNNAMREGIAVFAYNIADAMLAARKVTP